MFIKYKTNWKSKISASLHNLLDFRPHCQECNGIMEIIDVDYGVDHTFRDIYQCNDCGKKWIIL